MKLENSIKSCFLFAGAVLLTAAAVTAQEPGGMPQGGQQPMPGNQMPSAGASPNAPTAADGAPFGANMAAAGFVRKVFDNNQAQVQMSLLAQEKSTSDDVKQFGEQMVNIHNKLDEQLEPLAKQLGVNKPKGPSKKDKKVIEKLQGLSGESFDTAYLQAMADAQQQSLKHFNDEAKDQGNPGAQQAAKADTPVLEQNFQVLEKIAQAHKVEIETAKK
jgi:putative membrane protein